MKFNNLNKYLVILCIGLITSCNKSSNVESNVYKDMDARKMLFFNLENIKRNEEDDISNYVNKISYSYLKDSQSIEKTYRSESNIYSNNLETSDITILESNKTIRNIYKHAVINDYLYTYINENDELNISKNFIFEGDQDSYNLASSMFLKYDFLKNVQKSSIDLVESILLLPDTSFENLEFLQSSINDDKIIYNIYDDKYEYSLSRNYKEKINNTNYLLNINLSSTLNLNEDRLKSYLITYNYSLKKDETASKDGNNGINNEYSDIDFKLSISGASKYDRKAASEKEFEFINLINSD